MTYITYIYIIIDIYLHYFENDTKTFRYYGKKLPTQT